MITPGVFSYSGGLQDIFWGIFVVYYYDVLKVYKTMICDYLYSIIVGEK